MEPRELIKTDRMNRITAMALEAEAKYLGVGTMDGKVKLYGPGSGRLVCTLSKTEDDSQSTALRFSYSTHHLTLVRANGLIEHWDTANQSLVHTNSEHLASGNSLRCLDYTSDQTHYAVGGKDKNVYLYDANTM